ISRKENFMAKNGYKIFDSDTHVGPFVDIIDKYLAQGEKDKLAGWEQFKRGGMYGKQHVTYTRGERKYVRRLGTDKNETGATGYNAHLVGMKREKTMTPLGDDDPSARIGDMDYEGVDVNLMLPSGWFGTWTSTEDVALEMAMYRAYHRWLEDYCGAYPTRLGG